MQITMSENQLIEAFISERHIKQNSRNQYRLRLLQFFYFSAGHNLPWDPPSIDKIIAFEKDLYKRGSSAMTVYNYLITLKGFFYWANHKRFIVNQVFSQIKLPKRYENICKKPLSYEMIERVINRLDLSSEIGQRNYALFNLMVRAGLRCIEASRANVKDLRVNSGTQCLYIQGKGYSDKQRFVPLTALSTDPLMKYLSNRIIQEEEEPLFTSLSPRGMKARISSKGISQIISKMLDDAGIMDPQITPHSLRHTTGVNMAREGTPLYDIQTFLRHSSPNVTYIYIRYVEEENMIKKNPGKCLDKSIPSRSF